jgi:hypothetical protein
VADTSGAGIAGASAIGRYFAVVSFIPSTVFTAYMFLLFRIGAPGHKTVQLGRAFQSVDLRTAADLSLVSLVLAIALHPLQFALIQTLEGYWGQSWIGRRLAVAGILRHRRRARRLQIKFLDGHADSRPDPESQPFAANARATRRQVEVLWTSQQALRLYSSYPHRRDHIMPTRLGNVLRRYEQLAGEMYGLDTIASVPRLMQVADPRDVGYVDNQRMQLEMSVRTCALGLLATLVTAVVMLSHGWYLLLALGPYAVAYLSYRGAVVLAHEYGTALTVLVELNRFALYERLHLPLESTLARERAAARRLTRILRMDSFEVEKRISAARLRYEHPPRLDEAAASPLQNTPARKGPRRRPRP